MSEMERSLQWNTPTLSAGPTSCRNFRCSVSCLPKLLGERDSARRFQRVLVLRVNGGGDEEGEHCHGSRHDGETGDSSYCGACFYLLLLLFLRHRLRHKVRHGVFSLHKQVFY